MTPPWSRPGRDDLRGLVLPGGRCRIDPAENRLLHDAVRAPRTSRAHPIWAFLAPQRGMGLTLAELFEAFGCPLTDNPLLGAFAVRWRAPLEVGAPYRVQGGVNAVRRRRSRVLGPVDEVDLVLHLGREAGGGGGDDAAVLSATFTFLLPRPGADVPTAPAVVATSRAGTVDAPDVGPEQAGSPLTVRAAEMAQLARLLRDPNPIHLDPAAAAAHGHGPRCVNQGPANLAYVLDHLGTVGADAPLLGIAARFRATVRDGDVVRPVVAPTGDGRWRFALCHADGTAAVDGHAETAVA